MAERDLIIRILGDSKSVEAAFARSSRSATTFGRQVETTGTKLDRSAKSFSSFAKGAAAGFGGAVALNAAIRGLQSIVNAAAESEQVLGQTRVALESTGQAWVDYGAQIENAIQSQSRLGFDDEALLKTFSLFVRQSRDVNEALRRNAIAMNVARARFIDLEQAANLVNKAALGQAGALRRVGIDARTGASGVELLAQLEAQFAGAAEDASTRTVGATDRLKVSIENLQEDIGGALLPVVADLATALADVTDFASKAAKALNDLGSVRIPVIDIPLNFTIPGSDSKIADVAKEIAKQMSPLGPLFRAQEFANLFKDAPKPDTAAAARAFDAQYNDFFETLEDGAKQAAEKAKRRAAKFGEEGFKPVPNDLGERMARQFEATLDALDLKLDKAKVTADTADDLAVLNEIERAIRERMKTEGRTTDLLRQLFQVQQERQAILDSVKQQKEQARADRVDRLLDGLSLNVDRARLTKNLGDDLAALNALAAGLRRQIAQGGDVLRFQEQLVSVTGQIADVQQQIADNAASAVQARQFRALGLSATGGDLIPGVANLRKQLAQLSERLGPDISAKLKAQLRGVARVLSGDLGKVTEETRERIRDLFQTIRGTFDDEIRKGPLTKTSALNPTDILDGLGLTRDLEKELRARLSGFNTAGLALSGRTVPDGAFRGVPAGGAIVVENHNTIQLDGDVVASNVTVSQQKTRARNPRQKRGPNRLGGV